jgi:hypothetical protein
MMKDGPVNGTSTIACRLRSGRCATALAFRAAGAGTSKPRHIAGPWKYANKAKTLVRLHPTIAARESYRHFGS